jgi:hypothetical protein
LYQGVSLSLLPHLLVRILLNVIKFSTVAAIFLDSDSVHAMCLTVSFRFLISWCVSTMYFLSLVLASNDV